MKKIILILTLLSLITACDIIEAPYNEDNVVVVPEGTPKRALLIEFTGIKCNNCPPASAEAKRIIEKYEGNVIGLNIHASELARPSDPSQPNFRNATSNEIYAETNRPSLPGALISKFLDINAISYATIDWENKIVNVLKEEASIEISMKKIGADSSNIFEIEFFKEVSGQIRIASYIAESHIIGYQLGPTESYHDYEHNHVLRAAIFGNFCDDIDLSKKVDKKLQIPFTIPTLNDSWVKDNITIVTFVYSVGTGDVLQVNQFKLPS